MDLLFRGGTIVTDGLEIQADLGVTEGRVSHWGTALKPEPKTDVVEAEGRFLFPGAADFLVELPEFEAGAAGDPILWATGMAALGGITSLVIPLSPQPGRDWKDTLETAKASAQPQAFVDFGFHLAPTRPDAALRTWVRDSPTLGVSSVWLDPQAESNGGVSFEALISQVAEEAHDRMLLVVPLWDSAMAALGSQVIGTTGGTPSSPGKEGAAATDRFPGWMEAAVVERLGAVAEAYAARILIRAVAARAALESIKRSRERGGKLLAAASLAHLAFRNEEEGPQPGPAASCWPPVRGRSDQAFLWYLVEEGLLPVVTAGAGLFRGRTSPNGMGEGRGPGENLMLLWPVLYTEGVMKHRLSLGTLVQAVAADGAKLAGTYPTKGSLLIGSDADVVVFNPELLWQVGVKGEPPGQDAGKQGAETGGAFAGRSLQGAVEHVYLRGHAIVKDHDMAGEAGLGRFLERRLQL